MASITKREKSKYWIACFTNRDGRQLKRSTKTTDRNQAMQIARQTIQLPTDDTSGLAPVEPLHHFIKDGSAWGFGRH